MRLAFEFAAAYASVKVIGFTDRADEGSYATENRVECMVDAVVCKVYRASFCGAVSKEEDGGRSSRW